MAANYVLLERIELNASAASVTFNNIPQSGYTDLKLVVSARGDSGGTRDLLLAFNGSSANFTSRYLYGSGTGTPTSSTATTWQAEINSATTTANTYGSAELYIPNYLGSTNKSISSDSVTENNATAVITWLSAGLWSNTAAINSIALTLDTGNFVQYSTFSLYGLAAVGTTPVIAPKASGGNITTDGTYWYHTFLASGTFTPATALTCDYLVVAGGGAGGGEIGYAGGGGAGGVRSTVSATGGGGSLESALATTANTSYSIAVGAGGTTGSSGSNSTFSTITSAGGGCAGYYNGSIYVAGQAGGSGGGAGTTAQSGGAGTANQGYAGGSGTGGAVSGGGGGAASAGGGNSAGSAITLSTWATATSTGVSSQYAGGGGGTVQGGSGYVGGGGGAGRGYGDSTTGQSATANTGSGGGGGGGIGHAGLGGSGIVIIRYTIA
jgi:hypothetical protein